MHIWVDADACPNPVKDILFRAANRTQIQLVLVANQHIKTPPSRFISSLQVPSGFDVADNEIIQRLNEGDVVITGDIPLAAEVIAKGGHCISPRGERFTKENMAQILEMRNFTTTLRDSGMIEGGGQKAFGATDKAAFANSLDQLLARLKR